MARTQLFSVLTKALRYHAQEFGAQPLSRRSFLQKSAIASTAVYGGLQFGAPSKAFAGNNVSLPEPKKAKVVIVGAGLAGLTLAYRLHTDPQFDCTLLEASGHLGGRVRTKLNFNSSGQFCEMGAELVDSGHVELQELAAELGVELQSLVDGDPLPEIFLINGERITSHDFLPQGRLHQALKNLVARAQKDLSVTDTANFDSMSLAMYLDSLRADQNGLLLEIIRGAYRGECGLEPEDQSAMIFLSMFGTHSTPPTSGLQLFGDSDEAFRILGGSEQLTQAIASRIQNRIPVQLHTVAESIRKCADGRWVLGLRSGSSPRESTSQELHADIVVFAIPYPLLAKISGVQTLGFSSELLHLIQNLKMGTNTKGFLNFRSKFWRENGSPAFNGSLYTDQALQQFWETSRGQTGEEGLLTLFLGGKQGKQGADSQLLSTIDSVLPNATKELTHFQQVNWSRNPWSLGSYSSAGVGQYASYVSVHENLESHLPTGIFLAGEQTVPEFQGFMNGAISSGEKVSTQIRQARWATTKIAMAKSRVM